MSKEDVRIFSSTDRDLVLRGELIIATQRGYDMLEKEIDESEARLVSTTEAMGESANNDNDLRENYGFRDLRLKAHDELPRRIGELKSKRSKIILFPESDEETSIINFGDKFEIEMHSPNSESPMIKKFQLVGPLEIELDSSLECSTDGCQRISYLSPFGMAVWGVSSKPGSEFKYKIGNNEVRCVVVSEKK